MNAWFESVMMASNEVAVEKRKRRDIRWMKREKEREKEKERKREEGSGQGEAR